MRKRLTIFGLGLAAALGIVACGGNDPPTANAGEDVEVIAGDRVELSGESSADPDGDSLTYRWQLVSKPQESAATLLDPGFTTPALQTDAPGEYELSLVVNDGSDDSISHPVLVTARPWFADVTEVAGVPGGGAQDYESGYGSGAAWGNYDNDGDVDLYVTRDGPNHLYRNNGDGTFTDMAAGAGVDSPLNSYGSAWGDFDNDRDLDLYVTNHGDDQEGDLDHAPGQANLLYRNNGDGTFTNVASEAGVDHEAHGIGAIWADFDRDGWLDAFISNLGVLGYPQRKAEPNLLLRNNQDATFQEIGAEAGVSGDPGGLVQTDQGRAVRSGLSFGAVWLDYDDDRDPDLFVASDQGVSPLYRNDGDGSFVDVTEEAGLLVFGRARGAVGGDYDNDGDTDLYVTDHDQNRLWRNNGDGTFTDVAAEAGVADSLAGWGAGFIDLDNDGHLDLYVVNGASGADGPEKQANTLYRNNGDGTFMDITSLAGIGDEGAGRGVAFSDYDGDGDTDIYVVNADGRNVLYRNEIGTRQNWLRVGLTGTKSNINGIGVKVEVTTPDRMVRSRSLSGGSGYLGQSGMELIIGLGSSDRADVVITWPTGIVQDFWSVRPNRAYWTREGIMEGSCPMVFAWNGSTYSFVSDILGSAVTGFFLAPDVYRFPIDTDECLLIESLKARDGVYSIQIVELLNEVVYMDYARLLVVDHPSDEDVFPNERLALFPPFPEFEIRVAKDARPPVSATGDNGDDVLHLISKKDGIYVEDFEQLPYEGFAEEHSMVLDLGDLSGAESILLLMDGWTHYVTSYGIYAASLNGVGPMLPRLDVLDAEGNWVTVAMDMGFPAGQPKTMTYELTGKFLTDEYKVRITTNLQIFWDQILASTDTGSRAARTTELEPLRADTHWKGYPMPLTPAGDRRMYPANYDYDVIDSETERWVVPEGSFTRYGDVTPLLGDIDDMYSIMGPGDELTLEFDAGGLPELPEGWSRSFILCLDGFLKYVDPYVAYTSNVEPLPFHAMSGYPYPPDEGYPDDEAHLRYLREYNTR